MSSGGKKSDLKRRYRFRRITGFLNFKPRALLNSAHKNKALFTLSEGIRTPEQIDMNAIH
jgi:hypothetical protein